MSGYYHQMRPEAKIKYTTISSQSNLSWSSNLGFIDIIRHNVRGLKRRLRWSRVSVLAFGTQVRGFKPGQSRRIFQSGKKKILSTLSFGKEVKPFVSCRIFAARKRTRKCMRGSRSFRSKLQAISRPSRSSFHY